MSQPVVELKKANYSAGDRPLWHDLSLSLAAGEFLAVLGPNGSGKTSLLRVLLGLSPLTSGSVQVGGLPPERGSNLIGYVPQQAAFDEDVPLRGRDLVRLGLDGHRFGLSQTPGARERIDEVLREVGAESFADAPVGRLSGGEQQRLRIAQALLTGPQILLCDEPLLSLDLSHQQGVSRLINERRRTAGTAVVFVTHEINPILQYVDRVLYLVAGRWAIGKPDEVLTTERLTELYGAPVDVLKVRGRIIVVGGGEAAASAGGAHHLGHGADE